MSLLRVRGVAKHRGSVRKSRGKRSRVGEVREEREGEIRSEQRARSRSRGPPRRPLVSTVVCHGAIIIGIR